MKKLSENCPSSKWCFSLLFKRQDDKGPVVVLEGGGGSSDVNFWQVLGPAWSS